MNQQFRIDPTQIKLPQVSIRLIASGLIVLAILIGLFSSWFTINPEQVGVVLRFGKYNRIAPSGLNFKMPFGVEKVYKVATKRQEKLEFGFETVKAGIRTVYSKKSFLKESLLLTGDLNAAEVQWIVQYRISDPYKYLFKVREPVSTFRDINESVMREVVGDRTINEVLTVGREEIANDALEKMQVLADKYEIGIKVYRVVLQSVFPPERVKPSFNEVNQAQQERQKMINQAQQEYNKVIPKARGEAAKMVEVAQGYKLERVNQAKGEADKFNAVFMEYMKAPEVTHKRIYLETMNEILKNVDKKIITDKEIMGMLPLFNMSEKGGIQ